MKYYAVIDTNVVVSALLKMNSVPGCILELAFEGPIVPILNDAIEQEYLAVLSRPKFRLTDDIVTTIVGTFRRRGLYLDPAHIDIELPDPKDRVFYEIVMEERKKENAYLVTGNIKHFPQRSFIVSPRQMLDIILKNQDQ